MHRGRRAVLRSEAINLVPATPVSVMKGSDRSRFGVFTKGRACKLPRMRGQSHCPAHTASLYPADLSRAGASLGNTPQLATTASVRMASRAWRTFRTMTCATAIVPNYYGCPNRVLPGGVNTTLFTMTHCVSDGLPFPESAYTVSGASTALTATPLTERSVLANSA